MTSAVTEYGKVKVGLRTVDDATINLTSLERESPRPINKDVIYRALALNDIPRLREISNYFYKTSGIYQSACNYFATMYRYDWYITTEVYDDDGIKEKKVVGDFKKVLTYLDNSYVKKTCADIALQVIKNGAYYGYIVPTSTGVVIQELPVAYCRSRYNVGNLPAVEFNMKFFDVTFPDTQYRTKVLNMFPEEFRKGYVAYKTGKLPPESMFDSSSGWWLLDPERTAKFSFANSGFGCNDIPLFVNAIPAIIDLESAQELDRKKQMQKLLKILVQKLPMDKNGDLIFDNDEARDIHNNAVRMLQRAIGVDVLTTFADIDSVDMSDKNTTASQDDLEKVERGVYQSLGISSNLFNATGNTSLATSILNDEGTVRTLPLQFEVFFDRLVQNCSTNRRKYNFRFYMLQTTQYNYKELAKLYKDQTQLGYPRLYAQIALGHSQSSILNMIHFENEVLHLSEIMMPPLMSSTMSMSDLKDKNNQTTVTKTQNNTTSGTSGNSAGRPEKPDQEKSEKTLQNKESMS